MKALALNNFCFLTKFKSKSPAFPLVRTCPTKSARSTSLSLFPGNLKPIVILSASGPTTSFTTGAVIGASGEKVYLVTGFSFI